MAEVTITKDNFQAEVLDAAQPVLVDFWATWCGPCRRMAPIVAQLAEDYAGQIKVGKVNVDEEPELANRYSVNAIPTLILFRDGLPDETLVGYRSREQVEAMWA